MFMKLGNRQESGLDNHCRSLPDEILYSAAARGTVSRINDYKCKWLFFFF